MDTTERNEIEIILMASPRKKTVFYFTSAAC